MPREKIEVNTDPGIIGPNVKMFVGVLFFIAALVFLSYCPVIFYWYFDFYHLPKSEVAEVVVCVSMMLTIASLVWAGWVCVFDKE